MKKKSTKKYDICKYNSIKCILMAKNKMNWQLSLPMWLDHNQMGAICVDCRSIYMIALANRIKIHNLP